MVVKNPLSLIKLVAVGTVKAPVTAGRAAVGTATGAVTSLLGARSGGDGSDGTSPDENRPAPQPEPQPEPVNVTQELGVDPAPVTKPKARSKKTPKPVTEIDAAADPSAVTVTPADVAEVIVGDAPTADKSAAKKSARQGGVPAGQ